MFAQHSLSDEILTTYDRESIVLQPNFSGTVIVILCKLLTLNRAEKSSDWLSAVGRSIEDGDATYV